MSEKKTWTELREQRSGLAAVRAGYEEARKAYDIGRQVRSLREAQGLSQRELAERMGTTQSAIARLEAGGSRPSLFDPGAPGGRAWNDHRSQVPRTDRTRR